MNQFKVTLLTFAIAGLFTIQAQAAEIQWATGCTSFQSPAIISVSYNTSSQQMTLYRTWPSNQQHTVELYRASSLSPHNTPTLFRSTDSNVELPVEFGTKNSFSLNEGGRRIDYFCTYYSFDTNE